MGKDPQVISVNLPRWGLKLKFTRARSSSSQPCVNLPRWGLKLARIDNATEDEYKCKFTPLGFETVISKNNKDCKTSVNLPRWGLKHRVKIGDKQRIVCKFTPLGFETRKWNWRMV